jgi:two-component system response regulator MtrA
MSTILIVEDDSALRLTLRLLLEDEGYKVSEFADGESVLDSSEHIDLALVDLRLPGISGYDVVRHLRRSSDLPIIIVSAQVDSHDIVAGRAAGADDYVTKPFIPQELMARIRANLRRARQPVEADQAEFQFDDLVVRPATGEVLVAGESIAVTKTELGVLTALLEAEGKIIDRDELLSRVWGYDYLGDSRMVDAHVHRLRHKIEADPTNPHIVLTVRGLGYRIGG